jgi:drug/metabolite transporter (DMT)-like permease
MNSDYLLATSILLAVGGQILLKLGVMRLGPLEISPNIVPVALKMALSWGILAGILVYAVSAFLWIIALSKSQLSYAYPMVASSYVAVSVLSWLIFNEHISPTRIAALSLIVAGVILLARS